MLTCPEEEVALMKSGKSQRQLKLVQFILFVVFIVDASFLLAHYGFGYWTGEGHIENL